MKQKLIIALCGLVSGLIVGALIFELGYLRERKKLRSQHVWGESTTPVPLDTNGIVMLIPSTNGGVWVRKSTNQYAGGLFVYVQRDGDRTTNQNEL